ncbi:MAG: flagellar motor protein MotB [Elusimicrobiota bacterium]
MAKIGGYSAIPEAEGEGGGYHESPLWMLIYTDLMTNLMIFFLLSYCLTWLSQEDQNIAAQSFKSQFAGKNVSQLEKAVPASQQQPTVEDMEKEKKMEDELKKTYTNISINEEEMRMTLPTPVLFGLGEAVMKKEAVETLHEFAMMIKPTRNRIVVEGHTDDKPILGGKYVSNWELSAARAFSVVQYLIDKEGIDPKRLAALGYGQYRMVAPNDSEANRAKNRRIEITIVRIKEASAESTDSGSEEDTSGLLGN